MHVVSATDRSQVARELGAIGFAIKPTTRERLVTAIEQLEQTSQRDMRRLLILEDDNELRHNLELLLGRDQLQIVAVGTLASALEQLSTVTFDCMVMDLSLPDGSGYDLLEHMAGNDDVGFPPVIVYTGRALSREEEQRLRRYSKSIIIKGARSPERLLDEVTLFLHSVEASLPSDQQRLLREARRRDTVLDGRTVLLAEDDVRNIFALSSVLEPLGVTLEIARNGQEAVDRLAEREVDLVLMDIMMPEKDGLAAMREIRAQRHLQDLPIIALTARPCRTTVSAACRPAPTTTSPNPSTSTSWSRCAGSGARGNERAGPVRPGAEGAAGSALPALPLRFVICGVVAAPADPPGHAAL